MLPAHHSHAPLWELFAVQGYPGRERVKALRQEGTANTVASLAIESPAEQQFAFVPLVGMES